MEKFIVDRVELIQEDDFQYYGIFDSENNNWYEEQSKFSSDNLKIIYNKDTLRLISTSKDVSMLSPTQVGEVVEEIEYVEIDNVIGKYFVQGKIIELKDYEKIENGEVVFDREKRISELKNELYNLRVEYDVAPFEFEINGKMYLQNNRSIDQSNLTRIVVRLQATGKTSFEDWKFYTKEGGEEYVTITLTDMMKMANMMQAQTTKSMRTETTLVRQLSSLTDEELKAFDTEKEYDTLFNA